jgi:hypothetical protein
MRGHMSHQRRAYLYPILKRVQPSRCVRAPTREYSTDTAPRTRPSTDAESCQREFDSIQERLAKLRRDALARQGEPRSPQRGLERHRMLQELKDAFRTVEVAKQSREEQNVFVPYEDYHASCLKQLEQLISVRLDELRHGKKHFGRYLLVRRVGMTVVGPWSSSIGIEDETGDTETLRFTHFDTEHGIDIWPEGILLAIKEPLFSTSRGGSGVIVRHPSDFLVLDNEHHMVPQQFRKPAAIVVSGTRDACRLYWIVQKCTADLRRMHGQRSGGNGDRVKAELLLARAQANLLRRCYDTAETDALSAVSIHDSAEFAKPIDALRLRALQVASGACYALRDFQKSRSHLDEMMRSRRCDAAVRAEAAAQLERVHQRELEQRGMLNFSAYRERIKAQPKDSTVGDFLERLSLRDAPGKGRGLFATKDIGFGDVVMYEQALRSTWYYNDRLLNGIRLRADGATPSMFNAI